MKINRMSPKTREEFEELRKKKRLTGDLTQEESNRLARLALWDNGLRKRRRLSDDKFRDKEFRSELKDLD